MSYHVQHVHSCGFAWYPRPQKGSKIVHCSRPSAGLDLHHLNRRQTQRWKIHPLALHNETKNVLYFPSQVMCKRRESERYMRGRVMPSTKFKNESKPWS